MCVCMYVCISSSVLEPEYPQSKTLYSGEYGPSASELQGHTSLTHARSVTRAYMHASLQAQTSQGEYKIG